MFCWFLYHKELREGFYEKESSTESLKEIAYLCASINSHSIDFNATENSLS